MRSPEQVCDEQATEPSTKPRTIEERVVTTTAP